MASAAARSIARRYSSGAKAVVERVSARVFCHLEEKGGNPVTIFSSNEALSPATRQKLAQDCEWESVMIHNNQQQPPPQGEQQQLPKLSFYMPSGEQVSFCAHAAMGAALEICLQSQDETLDEVSFAVANLQQEQEKNGNTQQQQEQEEKEYFTTIYDGDIVALNMKTVYHQTNISHPPMLYRMLRDNCRVDVNDLASTPANSIYDRLNPKIDTSGMDNSILCHASIARPKTLVPLRSIQDLNEKALAPRARPTSFNGITTEIFAVCCKALDETTGLYLYTKSQEEDGAWECRQFPRASGYPEDPATGIAAAALACHLYHEYEIELPTYKFYQGTAMGKPSLIVVDQLEMRAPTKEMIEETKTGKCLEASFRLLGRVEIDDRDTIEITDDGSS